MEKSNNYNDVIQNSQQASAHTEDQKSQTGISEKAPEFQLKMNPLQKQPMEEEEEMLQPKSNPVQKESMEEEEEMLQTKSNPVQKESMEEEEEMLQTKSNPVQKESMEEEEEMLQTKSNPMQKKEEEEEEALMKRSNKKPYQIKAKQVEKASTGVESELPPQLKESMGNSLDSDFSNTKIYTNSEKAVEMGALAYAQGDEIHFAPGKYDPESQDGKELIGHELTHIVQQKKGIVRSKKKEAGVPVNNEFKLEKEADDLGKKAADSSFEDAPRRTDLSYEQHKIDQQPTKD